MNLTSATTKRWQSPGPQYSQRAGLRWILLSALLIAAAALGGCGNKGPLKLPEDSGEQAA